MGKVYVSPGNPGKLGKMKPKTFRGPDYESVVLSPL